MQKLEIEELESLAAPDGTDVAIGVGIGILAGDILWAVGAYLGEAAVVAAVT